MPIKTKTTLHELGLLTGLLQTCLDRGLDINQRIELTAEEVAARVKLRAEAKAAQAAQGTGAHDRAHTPNHASGDDEDDDTDDQAAASTDADAGAGAADGERDSASAATPRRRFRRPPTLRVEHGGCSILHLACRHDDNAGLVRSLLALGANVDIRDANGCTPAFAAVVAGAWQCLEVLLRDGHAAVDVQDLRHGHTLLMSMLLALETRDQERAAHERVLQENRWTHWRHQRPPPAPQAYPITQMLRLALAAGVNVNQRDKTGRSALLLAVGLGLSAGAKALLEHGADPNLADTRTQTTPLLQALARSSEKNDHTFQVERALLRAGGDIHARDIQGRTCMHFAFDWKPIPDADSTAHTQRHGGGKGQQQRKQEEESTSDPIEMVSNLCAVDGIDVDVADAAGRTPLMHAALAGAVISTRYLLQRGADVTKRDLCGNSAFGLALLRGHVNYAVLLINHGVDLMQSVARNPDGHVPTQTHDDKKAVPVTRVSCFRHILKRGYMGLAYLLMDEGVDIFTAMNDALEEGRYQLILTMFDKTSSAKLTAPGADQRTLLHVLAAHEPPAGSDADKAFHAVGGYADKIATALVDVHGLTLATTDTYGQTALHVAAAACSPRLVERFAAAAPELLTASDATGRTPAVCVFSNAQPAAIRLEETVQALLSSRGGVGSLGLGTAAAGREAPLSQVVHWLLQADEQAGTRVSAFGSAAAEASATTATAPPPQGDTQDDGEEATVTAEASNEESTATKAAAVAAAASTDAAVGRCSVRFEGDAAVVHRVMVRLLDPVLKLDPNAADASGMSGLLRAVAGNSERVVRALIEACAAQGRVLDINAVGPKGQTAVHVLFGGGAWASHENERLLRLLAAHGADLRRADAAGRTPLGLAAAQASGRMFAALVALGVGSATTAPVVHEPSPPSPPPTVPFAQDVEVVYAAIREKLALQQAEAARERTLAGPQVDRISGLAAVAEVLPVANEKDSSASGAAHTAGNPAVADNLDYYDVTLTYADSSYGRYGQNMFYRLSVLYNRVQDLHVLWTRWGSIGEDGMHQKTPFPTRAACIAEFEKIFKSKTGNTWALRRAFEEKDGKYTLQTPAGETVAERQLAHLRTINPMTMALPTAQPTEAQLLFRLLSDTHLLAARAVAERPFQLPLGVAHDKAVTEAYGVLMELDLLLTEIQAIEARLTAQLMATTDLTQQLHALRQKVAKLSNRFYRLVPAQRKYNSAVTTRHELAAAVAELNLLSQQNAAGQILTAAHARQADMHPYDYMLRAVQTALTPLPLDGDVGRLLCAYANPGPEPAEQDVAAIFAVHRKGEAARFEPYARRGNRMLLWHGSCAANVVGILKDGLCCAPPTAQVTGHAFGKGVYFADVAGKSLGYASNVGGNPNTSHHSLLFVAEVFLGKMDLGGDRPRDGYDSVVARGRREPRSSLVVAETGARIPSGPLFDGMFAEGGKRG